MNWSSALLFIAMGIVIHIIWSNIIDSIFNEIVFYDVIENEEDLAEFIEEIKKIDFKEKD